MLLTYEPERHWLKTHRHGVSTRAVDSLAEALGLSERRRHPNGLMLMHSRSSTTGLCMEGDK
jgi:hypothetical protein